MTIVQQGIIEYRSINVITTYPNYDEATTYLFGEIIFDDHWYYRSIVDDNLGNKPNENPNEWMLWSVSNRYAQVDLRSTTITTWDATTATNIGDNALISEFTNNNFATLAFGNVKGAYVLVELFDDADALVWSSQQEIYPRPSANTWYGYYFAPFTGTDIKDSVYFNLPTYTLGGYYKVTVGKTSEELASVGYMVAGKAVWVGDTLFGVNVGLDDNSLIEIDDYGITSVTRRIASRTLDVDVTFPSGRIGEMTRIASFYQGKIVLFVADEDQESNYDNLLTLGYVSGFNTILDNSIQISASYSVKEVI